MKQKNNLFDHISQVLHNHREPYVLGEWERFQQKKIREEKARTRKVFFKIAATILLILTVGFAWSNFSAESPEFFADEPMPANPEIFDEERSEKITEPEDSLDLSDPVLAEKTTALETTESVQAAAARSPENPYSGETSPIITRPVFQATIHQANEVSVPEFFALSDRRSEPFAERNESAYDRIITRDDLQQGSADHHQKDFTFSLAYASVMNIHDSNTDLGMGGGFYTDWNIGKSIALTSGVFISQNRLKYQNKPANGLMMKEVEDAVSTTFELTPDNLSSMQIDHLSLEIPLNLRYSLSSQFSVSAGISSIAFLKEDYDYNFEQEHRILVAPAEGTLASEPVTRTVLLRTSATQTEPSLDRMDWAAFLNFSVGYQHELPGNYTVSFEPFLKLPTGRVASRDITYTTGGLQLRISF